MSLTRPTVADPYVRAYFAGSEAAAEDLIRAHHAPVRAAVRQFLLRRGYGNLDLAEDVTHDLFIALFRDDGRKLRSFEGRGGASLGGWLRVVAIRLAIDLLRREHRHRSLDDGTPAMEDLQRTLAGTDATPEEATVGREVAGRLQRLVAALAPRDRLLCELHLVRGLPLDRVATVLGASMNATYVRKSRVLARLRAGVAEESAS